LPEYLELYPNSFPSGQKRKTPKRSERCRTLTSFLKSWQITAYRSIVLKPFPSSPSLASPNVVSKKDLISPAGRNSTMALASVSPTFHQEWAVPGGTITSCPSSIVFSTPPERNQIFPLTIRILSSEIGCACPGYCLTLSGNGPWGRTDHSKRSKSLLVAGSCSGKVTRSPLKGFSITAFARETSNPNGIQQVLSCTSEGLRKNKGVCIPGTGDAPRVVEDPRLAGPVGFDHQTRVDVRKKNLEVDANSGVGTGFQKTIILSISSASSRFNTC